MIIIMGIDPALNNVGYGILSYDEINRRIVDVKYGVYNINQKEEIESRLNATFITTQKLIDDYNIDDVALEMAVHNPRRAKGGFKVREAIGALKVAIFQKGKPIKYYMPQKIKKDISGNGSADKIEMAIAIAKILGISEFIVEKKVRNKMVELHLTPEMLIKKKLDHISDALSIAYCRVLEIQSLQKEAV